MSDLFATKLLHQFTTVNDQIEAGLHGLKATSTTLKEICSYQKGCKDVNKILKQHEANYTKTKKIDMQENFSNANISILQSMGRIIADGHQEFLQNVLDNISG